MKYRFLTRAVYEADKGNDGQGASGNSTPDNDPNKAPEKPQDEAKAFTQADVDRIVAERLERAKKQADTIAQKAKDDAEKKALEEQGKFKELAEQATKRALDLEAKAEEADRLREALKSQLETLRKGLPDYVITLLDNLDVAAQLKYLAENRDKLVKPTNAPEINGGGGKIKANSISDDERAKAAKRVHATF